MTARIPAALCVVSTTRISADSVPLKRSLGPLRARPVDASVDGFDNLASLPVEIKNWEIVAMLFFRLLPWEYAIRNLFRRPLRTALTLLGLTTVILLVFVVVGFIRGLDRSLAVSGDPRTGVLF